MPNPNRTLTIVYLPLPQSFPNAQILEIVESKKSKCFGEEEKILFVTV